MKKKTAFAYDLVMAGLVYLFCYLIFTLWQNSSKLSEGFLPISLYAVTFGFFLGLLIVAYVHKKIEIWLYFLLAAGVGFGLSYVLSGLVFYLPYWLCLSSLPILAGLFALLWWRRRRL